MLNGLATSATPGDVRPIHEQIAAQLSGAIIWLVGGGDLVGQF